MGSKNVLATVTSPLTAGPIAVKNAFESSQKNAAQKLQRTQDAANTAAANSAQDLLIANESVAAQKEKQRKQTVFAGSGDANLFNKSLIGTSTSNAAGTQRSILGV